MTNAQIENFLESMIHRLSYSAETVKHDYDWLYDKCPHAQEKLLLSQMHYDLVQLFVSMNTRLPTDDTEAYYWAETSRNLKEIIDVVFTMRSNLAGTSYAFKIDSYYEKVLNDCNAFLKVVRGSTIPKGMDRINIYYRLPIFLVGDDPVHEEISGIQSDNMVPIGRGGFGEVYRYHHDSLDMDFAIKRFCPMFANDHEREIGEKRFFREAKILLNLSHPNIVKVYDAGRIQGQPYIRMEYIDGMDLDGVYAKYGQSSFDVSTRAIIQICEGMKCAHQHGIIHRDLKPSNIMWCDKHLKIIDFGISAFIESDQYTKLTRTGEMVAGGRFIDPILQEQPQLRDHRVDIYSIGAIWFFLLTGHAPMGTNMKDYLMKCNNSIHEKEADIVLKCLSVNLDERYSDCQEIIDAISMYS